ncbi:LytTR family DNA-binding domain-containing protein [Lewinella sp. W8]|uniref:LytR/AlgR family response regulator transcription factor n=1 Tax=Lewinella sp. W8 TaxID=2528208 RepID=UPI0010689174|nr:response regulator [Lewinella sp. W8]MTB50820.1 response regulator [Lewinella sp. W8]
MNILIIEDQPLYADQLEILCEKLGYTVVACCPDAFTGLDAFHRHHPDLLLSDIHLAGDVDGIDLAQQLNAHRPVPVIFITSLRDAETFARAQSVLPLAFIVKPFTEIQLQRSIELAVARLAAAVDGEEEKTDFTERDLHHQNAFFVKVGNKLEKISVADIAYVAADGRYCMIHLRSGRKFAVRIPLSELSGKLSEEVFVQSHRSYLVNADLLESVNLTEMTLLVSGQEVPISKGYRETVLNRLEQL